MLPQLFKTIFNTFFHNPNQFASGGFLLMLVGGLAAYFRSLPEKIYEHILHLFSMTVTITDDSQAFIWFKWWFREHERSKKIRHVDIITPQGCNGIETMFFPAPGSHWFMYKKRPFRMTFSRTEEKKALFNGTRPETIVLRVLGRNQQFLRDFIDDVQKKFSDKNKRTPSLYFWSNGWWDEMPFTPRPLDSVFLPKNLKEEILKDIQNFKQNKYWYESTGMPYHRSYLLYGPPGTGKTSTLLGLASHFKMSMYLIKLAHIGDDTLVEALHKVGQNSMVIFEDVDCLKNKREELTKDKKKKKDESKSSNLTLSGLLNALDGIETPSGSLFFMTTNLIESLDPALIRPGRVDQRIFLGPASWEQKINMSRRFYPSWTEENAEKFIKNNPKAKTMAEFQEVLKLLQSQTA